MVIPATAKKIIEEIITQHHYSINEIAQAIGMSSKALYNIQNEKSYSPNTDSKLMQFYIQLNVISALKKEKGAGNNSSRKKILTLQENKHEILKLEKSRLKKSNKGFKKNLAINYGIKNYFPVYIGSLYTHFT